jgi:UDP:flavonoid glycosyltransferase YjiC (YdhE family)
VPFSQVFPRAAALVFHGGVGTMAQALAAGLPQLVMPMTYDQPDNADRLRRLGVGRSLKPKQFTGPNVARELGALLTDPGVAARAKELANRFPPGDPTAATCDELEALGRTAGTCAAA